MMTKLNLAANFENGDDFYAALLAVHDGLSDVDVHALNARLILILANHVGDQSVLAEAIKTASLR
jgi:hypothetical protein